MSLMERAAVSLDQRQELGINDAVRTLEALRSRVGDIVPSTEAARLIAQSPRQARSEMRLACERILKDEPWLVKGALTRDEMIERYLDEVFGLGSLEDLLEDEDVTEIMVNGVDSLYYEKEGRLVRASHAFGDEAQVYSLIDKIISPLGRRIDESSPMVNARLAQGHRVNAIIPPISIDGPIITIRKFRSHAFSLDEMQSLGSFDGLIKTMLVWAVRRRCNIAVSGGTGSGKTTLLNALSASIPPTERIVTIEDSAELRFTEHPHVVRLEARPRNSEGAGEVTIRDLVVNALRMRPDRIVVGECRGSEAFEMLQAMTTGHDGSLTTLHADSPQEAISRLTTMVRYGAELPVEVVETQIASAIDLVVQTTRYPDGSRGVCAVSGYEMSGNPRRCVTKNFYERDLVTGTQRWVAIPHWIDDLPYLSIASKEEVEQWKQSLPR